MAALLGRARATKGFLIELKKRIAFIEEGYRLLELKREELAKTIRSYLALLEAKRAEFERKAEKAINKMRLAYAFLGSSEADSRTELVGGGLEVQIYPKSVIGCIIPYVKEFKKAEAGKVGPVLRSIVREFDALVEDLIKISEVEACIERIAEELGATNRKVNALEKIIIPELEQSAKYIEDMLDEEMLEEVVRTKIVRSMLIKRRG
jgi:V/A-type H+-transporting ATPase subunit D